MSWCGSPRGAAELSSSISSSGCTVTAARSQSGVDCCLYSGLWLRARIAGGDARAAVLMLRVRRYCGGRCVAGDAESRTGSEVSSAFTLRFIGGDGCSPSHPSRSASSYSPSATWQVTHCTFSAVLRSSKSRAASSLYSS
eukprot:scaffold4146_cov63-Phaeocystis_antarctica.AAC.5